LSCDSVAVDLFTCTYMPALTAHEVRGNFAAKSQIAFGTETD
jgi:hypothetical protein